MPNGSVQVLRLATAIGVSSAAGMFAKIHSSGRDPSTFHARCSQTDDRGRKWTRRWPFAPPLDPWICLFQRARPVRSQAAKTVLYFLRYSPKENHRKWIREHLINSLCHSSSCYTRHIFINMCSEAIKLFSWKYFKEHFFMSLLELGGKYHLW